LSFLEFFAVIALRLAAFISYKTLHHCRSSVL